VVVDEGVTFQYIPHRGLSTETLRKYLIGTKVSPQGEPMEDAFNYPNGKTKVRGYDKKDFHWQGKSDEVQGLFGQNIFPPASAKAITITEGEYDAAAAYQMLGSVYPCVSIPNSASARKDCANNFDYLNSFSKIILALDNDDVGKKAAQEIAGLFDYNKVFVVSFDKLKDSNDYLQKGMEKEFRAAWHGSKRYQPEGVLSSFADFDKIIDDDKDRPSVPYPFGILNEKERGIRTGEFILVKAMPGVGKTEFFRAIEYHLLTTTSARIGACHLEESKARQLKGVAGYELSKPAHLTESGVSNEEIKEAYRKATSGEDGETRLHIYTHFGSDDPDLLLDAIRFLAAVCGCKYIFLDHISILVSGLEGDDERRKLDYISTNLAKMAHDLDFTIFVVTHVNDHNQTRGSRGMYQLAHTVIDLSRNTEAESEEERSKMYLNIPKARWTGNTGPAGVLQFSRETYKLTDYDPSQLPVE
jgi:twinkle protein